MKSRTVKRKWRDKPNYFAIELGDKGVHWFRMPLPIHSARLIERLREAGIADVDGTPSLAQTEALWMIAGASVGLCWYHESKDLEARYSDFRDDLDRYGEEVLLELRDDDYEDEDLAPLVPDLIGRIMRKVLGVEEVEERLDFSEAAKGSISS